MYKPSKPPIIITSGEPAGIGPDICLQVAQDWQGHPLVIAADESLLTERAQRLGYSMSLPRYEPGSEQHISVMPVPQLRTPVIVGELHSAHADYVIAMLQQAATGCRNGEFAAMVTAPVHKGILNEAGYAFSGHTEWLQAYTESTQSLMTFLSDELTLALLTTHCPLRDVIHHISPERVVNAVRLLQPLCANKQQSITILGINPHAGEQGHIGDEESTLLAPAIAQCRAQGYQVSDPMPADTVFSPHQRQHHRIVLSMYHDQALPVIKALSFGQLTQCTLGLPIMRFSVDHGTACHLAGTGKAKADSLRYTLQRTQQWLAEQ